MDPLTEAVINNTRLKGFYSWCTIIRSSFTDIGLDPNEQFKALVQALHTILVNLDNPNTEKDCIEWCKPDALQENVELVGKMLASSNAKTQQLGIQLYLTNPSGSICQKQRCAIYAGSPETSESTRPYKRLQVAIDHTLGF